MSSMETMLRKVKASAAVLMLTLAAPCMALASEADLAIPNLAPGQNSLLFLACSFAFWA